MLDAALAAYLKNTTLFWRFQVCWQTELKLKAENIKDSYGECMLSAIFVAWDRRRIDET
jgi:hypothetical protein